MASKPQITEEKIIDKKVYGIGSKFAKSLTPANKSIEKLEKDWLSSMNKIKESIIGLNDIQSKFKVAKSETEYLKIKKLQEQASITASKAIKEEKNTLIAIQKVRQAELDTQKKTIDLERKKAAAKFVSAKKSLSEKIQLQETNKALKLQYRESLGLVGAYSKLNAKRNQAQKTLANLLSAEKQNVAQIKKAQAEYNRLDARVKAVDRSTKNFSKNIGNYKSALGGLAGTFRSLASAAGLAGGAFLFVQVLRNGINIIRDFEKKNATLSAILQVERKDMQGLTEDATRLGSTTVKTATEVTELQIAYARLGFTQQEIINLTEGTIQGSIAMNAELSETAELTGAVINTFDDFSTTDAPRVLDIMSLATAKSALNFEKLKTGLPIVSGAANAAGVPFTKLVALMGKLSDSGIDVSSSSTALRNIFIESAAQGLNYSQIIEKVKGSQDKLTAANDEFGKRAAVSATVLAQNIDKTNELDQALQNAAGTAKQMAEKELDTLDGTLKLLTSSWEGLILSVEDGEGSLSKLLRESIATVTFALNKLSELNEAQGKVYENAGGKKWVDYLKNASIFTAFISTDYSKAVDLQKEFTKDNQSLNTLSLSNLRDRLKEVATGYFNLEDKSSNQALTYKAQTKEIQKVIDVRQAEREELEKTAISLGYNQSLEGQVVEAKRQSTRTLTQYVEANKEAEETVNETEKLTEEERKKRAAARKIRLDEEYNLSKFRIEQAIKQQDEISKNEEEGYLKRIRALQEKEDLQVQLEELTEANLLENKKLSAAERTLIEEKSSANLIEIYKKTNEEIDKLKADLIDNAPEQVEEVSDSDYEEDLRILKQGIKDYAETLGLDGEAALTQYLEAHGETFGKIEDYYRKLNKTAEESSALRKELERDLANSAIGFVNTLFDAKIQSYEDDITASNDKYDEAIASTQNRYDEEGNLIEESDRRRQVLEEQKEKKEKELRKKQNKEKRKQEIFNRALAVIGIATDLAGTISKIQLAAAALDAISFGTAGTPYRIVNTGIAIGTAALQTASILAAPLPKYKLGRKGGKAELAITGDGGVNEVVEKKDGRAYLTPATDTLTYLGEGDKVHSSLDSFAKTKDYSADYYKELFNQVSITNLNNEANSLKEYEKQITINNKIDEIAIARMINAGNKNTEKSILKAINKSLLGAKTVNNITVESGNGIGRG